MKTSLERVLLLVLVPHRDVRLPMRAWSAALFAGGAQIRAFFPHVAPLAALKRPLAAGELKALAAQMRRQLSLRQGGKFTGGEPAICELFAGGGVLGPVLSVDLPDFTPVADAIERPARQVVLGAALTGGCAQDFSPNALPSPPPAAFRAAALANMEYSHDGGFAEWKIGKLHWLPKKDM